MPSISQNGSDVHDPHGVESRARSRATMKVQGAKLFEAVGFYSILSAKSLLKFPQYYENVRSFGLPNQTINVVHLN